MGANAALERSKGMCADAFVHAAEGLPMHANVPGRLVALLLLVASLITVVGLKGYTVPNPKHNLGKEEFGSTPPLPIRFRNQLYLGVQLLITAKNNLTFVLSGHKSTTMAAIDQSLTVYSGGVVLGGKRPEGSSLNVCYLLCLEDGGVLHGG